MAEHHFQREGTECIPNTILMALHLAHRTKNIKIGCGFNITPMWHPLRLAEDFATADILTGGRVVFGVGRGYHTREVETFGSPLRDQEANRALFEEQVDIIFKAFNNERFSHKGKYYTLPPEVPYRGYTLKELTLVPRPFNLPVECWQPIQGGSMRALEFMAKHGIQGMVGGGSAEGGAMHKVVLDWQTAHANIGKPIELGERLCFGFHFYMANSREQGMKEAAKYYEENMKMFGELRLVRAITEEQIEIMRDPKRAPTAKLPRIEDAIKAGGFLCGTIVAHLMFDLAPLAIGTTVRSGPSQWLAEAVATFTLIVAILGGLRYAPTAIPWLVGLTITAAYWFTASTSFANPAVTLARGFTTTFAGIAINHVPAFIIAQLIGVAAAALISPALFTTDQKSSNPIVAPGE
jgi:alkanesulfonate monooxygenase SsuD/methylene tetrahydromethanopterin reductase-like flavin-dependent oxidoreductase (luciferase family)